MSGTESAPPVLFAGRADGAPVTSPPLDAVLFDLDGTLVATDRVWLPAAQRGARRALAELGLARALPTPREWLRLVGMPLDLGLSLLFPDLTASELRTLQERCEEEENHLIRAGELALLPGAREALTALRERGIRLGLASHCGRRYLEQVLEVLGIGPLFEAARCLDSPCVRAAGHGAADDFGGPKGRMIHDLLSTFGTRRAAFVGDRASDREAAHANGLPHFFYAGGFADPEEGQGADDRLEDLAELPGRLEGRWRWMAERVERLGLDGPVCLALSGAAGSGKHAWLADLAAFLASRGQAAPRWLELPAVRPEVQGPGGDGGQAHLAAALSAWDRLGPLVLIGRDLGGLDPGGEGVPWRRLHLVAPQAVRLRRGLGAAGPDASHARRQTVHEQLTSPARPLPGGPAEVWDLTVPWAPVRA